MKYFRIFYSLNAKEMGSIPQVKNIIIPTTFDDPKFIRKFEGIKAPENVLVPMGHLAKKAKKTDILTTGDEGFGNQLFISNKLYELCSTHSSKGIQYLTSKLFINNTTEETYWIVHPFVSDFDFLDINKCYFNYCGTFGDPLGEPFKFASIEMFIEALQKNIEDALINIYPNNRILSFHEVHFREDAGLHFFSLNRLNYGWTGYFISEELRTKIENAGCNGIVFKEINESPF